MRGINYIQSEECLECTQTKVMYREIDIYADINRSDVIVVWGGVSYAQRVVEFMAKRVQSDGHASQVRHWRVFRTYRRVMKERFREIRYILSKDYVEKAHRVQDQDIDIDEDID